MSAFERSRCQAYEPEEDEISLYPDDSLLDEEDEPDVNNEKKCEGKVSLP